jgi:hypothetical protein
MLLVLNVLGFKFVWLIFIKSITTSHWTYGLRITEKGRLRLLTRLTVYKESRNMYGENTDVQNFKAGGKYIVALKE